MIQQVYNISASGLDSLFVLTDFDPLWNEHFDRDHVIEANMVSDREVEKLLEVDSATLKKAAVQIMTLYMAIQTSGEMNEQEGVHVMMCGYRDLFLKDLEDHYTNIQIMMGYEHNESRLKQSRCSNIIALLETDSIPMALVVEIQRKSHSKTSTCHCGL